MNTERAKYWSKAIFNVMLAILFLLLITPNLVSENYDKVIANTLVYIAVILILRLE